MYRLELKLAKCLFSELHQGSRIIKAELIYLTQLFFCTSTEFQDFIYTRPTVVDGVHNCECGAATFTHLKETWICQVSQSHG